MSEYLRKINYYETDKMGIVHHSNYIRFMEEARVDFLDSYDYESAVRNAISSGGDSDTQATIAGGIAQAYYQEIPKHLSDFCLSRIDGTLKDVIREFEGKYLTNN